MSKFWLCAAAACAILIVAPASAQDHASPLVEQINNGNWLPQAEAQSLVDDLYFNQAI